MKASFIEPEFGNLKSEVLVIGVPEHPENVEGWNTFADSFSPRLMDWVKSGDIKTNFKEFVKMPALEANGYERVIFVGLGATKKLTEDRLRQSFAALGKELKSSKASSVAIWT